MPVGFDFGYFAGLRIASNSVPSRERYSGLSGFVDAEVARSSASFAAAAGAGLFASAIARISAANFCLIAGLAGASALIEPKSASNCKTACDFGGGAGAVLPGVAAGVGWGVCVGGATPWRTLF